MMTSMGAAHTSMTRELDDLIYQQFTRSRKMPKSQMPT